MMHRAAIAALAASLVGCAPTGVGSDPPDGTWVGTITTEGNVTTVINESGSVWGGTATLVEEASIGVDVGDEPYLLGNVVGVGVAGARIFVLDAQVLRVRVYDHEGAHLTDMGGEGDGPGELRGPSGLAVGAERVYVRDRRTGRITVFSTAGELLDTWPAPRRQTRVPMIATIGGELFAPTGGAMVPWGPEGPAGPEVSFPVVEDRPPRMMATVSEAIPGYSRGSLLGRTVPFWPLPVFAMSPTGAMIHGVADEYRFTIEQPDGSVTSVEKSHEPVLVADAEAAWHRARVGDFLRQAESDWEWDGPGVLDTKPAFAEFVPAVSGEVWVLRPGPGYEDTDCPPESAMLETPHSCWKDTRIVDIFDTEGRFAGEVDVPNDFRFEPRPFIRDDTVLAVVEDEAGTIMVKRYRLVLPGEEEP